MSRPIRPRRRPGFTLVELLAVILIIGLLTAILLPAVNAAVRAARDAAVVAEMNNMAAALTKFKNDFGDYPPSRIVLIENGDYSGTTTTPWLGNNAANYPSTGGDLSYAGLLNRSLIFLRKFWPRAQFNTNGTAVFSGTTFTTSPATAPFHDFNGNGTMDASPILLQGHECLAFFLGGIPNQGGGMTGFSRLPQFPFLNDGSPYSSAATPMASSRTTPAYEFNNGRLLDEDGDGIPGYLDTLGTAADARFYAYFSAYASGGSGAYDPNDVNFDTSATSTVQAASTGDGYQGGSTNPALVIFQAGFLSTGHATSAAPNPYTTSSARPSANSTVWVNAQSFQLISAGRDRNYGLGGQYLAGASGERLPVDPNAASVYPTTSAESTFYPTDPLPADVQAARRNEQDNLTNFSGGRLE